MTIFGYDTVASDFTGGIPNEGGAPGLPPVQAVLFYVDGDFANEQGARNRFPDLFILGRTVGYTVQERLPVIEGENADDFEPGNAERPAGPWAAQCIAMGVWRPILYADGSDMDGLVIPSLEAQFGSPLPMPGDPRRPIRTILANPDGDPTIPPEHDGKQYWFGSIQGGGRVDMDINALRDDFFAKPGPPPPPPPPKDTTMIATYQVPDGNSYRVGIVAENSSGEVFHIEQQHPGGDWWKDKSGKFVWLSLGTPGK